MIEHVRAVLRSPEVIGRTWRIARKSPGGLSEVDCGEALGRIVPLWDETVPYEQVRIVQLPVEQVDVGLDGAEIRQPLGISWPC